MANKPKTIWTLHRVVVFISVFLLIFITKNLWNSTVESTIQTQSTQVELFSNSLSSLIDNEDRILEVAGEQAIHNIQSGAPIEESIEIFDGLISDSGDMTAIRLMDLEGHSLVASSNIPFSNKSGLSDFKNSPLWQNFVETIESDRLVVGRTYYSDNLASYFIPFRKAIRNIKGDPVAVITGAVSLNNTGLINDSLLLGPHNIFKVVRNDGYAQMELPAPKTGYGNKIGVANKTDLADELEALKAGRNNGTIQSFYVQHRNTLYVGVTKYIPEQKLWVVSKVNQHYIFEQFLPSFIYIFGVFCALQWFIYVLIKRIYQSDKERRKELLYQANHDFLTGLPNRYYSLKQEKPWMNKRFALLYIDLDKFKVINDTYGHSSGDKLLVELAKRVDRLKPVGSLFVREAGDEFLLICEQSQVQNIDLFCRGLLEAISQPYQLENTQYVITASIGVALYPQHTESVNLVKRLADIAVLKAKSQRNTYCVFTPDMEQEHQQEALIEQRLRVALADESFRIQFQPQYRNGRIWGIEALARWNDDELGFVSPDKFIAIAESTGLMPQLGKLLLKKALLESLRLQKASNTRLQTAINISIIQFMEIDFVSYLTTLILDHQVDPSSITLELTESVLIEDLPAVQSKCEAIKQLGFELSLDDFGTGYSSLNVLHQLPVDELKIDRAFMQNLLNDKKCQSLVKSIISIGQSLEVRIVAEGVEDFEQVATITNYGAHVMQGYYYSRPLDVEALIQKLKERAA
ncbi:bifunctional diguanylate cyclase/phosphodiesterase [Vibrio ouci]|uniref:EAL domain-containing protein n=1 Tax=Vibrio ouci TaxID=2499078 RepID=A0A4Y8WBK9_9VIBR|nr:EAL domain-containing protein [Vibrio ouci]TFH90194.1 EAL domain-containing protein [Vibrio ouci]